jgi:hypothetical protein
MSNGSATIKRLPWLRVKSQFLFRGSFTDFGATFRRTPPQGAEYTLSVPTEAAAAVLNSKSWLKMVSDTAGIGPGDVLKFVLHSREEYADASSLKRVRVSGTVTRITKGEDTAAGALGAAAGAGGLHVSVRGSISSLILHRPRLQPSASSNSIISMTGGTAGPNTTTDSPRSSISGMSLVPHSGSPSASAGPEIVGSVSYEWPAPATGAGSSSVRAGDLKGNVVLAYLARASATQADAVTDGKHCHAFTLWCIQS